MTITGGLIGSAGGITSLVSYPALDRHLPAANALKNMLIGAGNMCEVIPRLASRLQVR